jgi:hypothetical protein
MPASVRILIGGDLLPHRPRLFAPERIANALAPLQSLLAGVDVAVANYETATGDPQIFGAKSISLAVPQEWMSAVAHANLHALTLANNHACDRGRRGLDASLEAAKSLDVIALGADASDPWQARVLAEKDGHKVCALAWTTFVNAEGQSCKGSGALAVAGFDHKGGVRIDRAIARARQEGCGALVAIVHGGREYAPQIWGPRAQARRAAEAGADAVVMHHPHVPSPVEVLTTTDGRRVPVFASVGNLVSNQGESWRLPYAPQSRDHLISLNAWTRLGLLADLEWTWSGPDPGASLTWGYHLLWTDNDHALDRRDPLPRIQVRPVDPIADKVLLDRLATDEQGPRSLLFDKCWLEGSQTRCDATRTVRQGEPIF